MNFKLKIIRDGHVSFLACESRRECDAFIRRIEVEHENCVLRAVARARASRKGPQTVLAKVPARPACKILSLAGR